MNDVTVFLEANLPLVVGSVVLLVLMLLGFVGASMALRRRMMLDIADLRSTSSEAAVTTEQQTAQQLSQRPLRSWQP